MPVIVVDSVSRIPTENARGVTQRLPPPPATPEEFEVASVKPSRQGAAGMFRIGPNGRVELRGRTLQNLITLAWDIEPRCWLGAPKWLNTDRFDVVAAASSDGGMRGAPVDFESVQVMMRALLIERFKLAVHNATQPVNVYALIAPKHETKMKKADESTRSSPGRQNPLARLPHNACNH
jgi:uncharacterized protein (TIGR03435 family)